MLMSGKDYTRLVTSIRLGMVQLHVSEAAFLGFAYRVSLATERLRSAEQTSSFPNTSSSGDASEPYGQPCANEDVIEQERREVILNLCLPLKNREELQLAPVSASAVLSLLWRLGLPMRVIIIPQLPSPDTPQIVWEFGDSLQTEAFIQLPGHWILAWS